MVPSPTCGRWLCVLASPSPPLPVVWYWVCGVGSASPAPLLCVVRGRVGGEDCPLLEGWPYHLPTRGGRGLDHVCENIYKSKRLNIFMNM